MVHKLVTATEEQKKPQMSLCDFPPMTYQTNNWFSFGFIIDDRHTSASQEQGSVLGSSVLAWQSLHLQEANTKTHMMRTRRYFL